MDGKTVALTFPSKPNLVFFGEDLRQTHTIFYDALPDNVLFFDVYDKAKNRFFSIEEKTIEILSIGGLPVPVIGKGFVSEEELEEKVFTCKSAFKTKINPKMKDIAKEILPEYIDKENFIEGIVVKNYEMQLMGKVVNPIFERVMFKAGRYEKYEWYNRIIFFDEELYMQYLEKHVLKHLNSDIDLSSCYLKYASFWCRKL